MQNLKRLLTTISLSVLILGCLQAKPAYAAVTITVTTLTPADNSTVTITGTQQVVSSSANASITTTTDTYMLKGKLAYLYQDEEWGSISDNTQFAFANTTKSFPLSFGYTLYKLPYKVQFTVTATAPGTPTIPGDTKTVGKTNSFQVQ